MLAVLAGCILVMGQINDNHYKVLKEEVSKKGQDVTAWELYPKSVEGVKVEEVHRRGLQGFHLVPEVKKHPGIILCYGGSEGSPNFLGARRFAEEGFETMALFFFGQDHQPKSLREVPLEEFEDVKSYLADAGVEGPIYVYGGSKGAEYALQLAVHYPEIEKVVAVAPASHTFSGLDPKENGSSWTYKGKELPYVDVQRSSFPLFVKNILFPLLTRGPIDFEPSYNSALDKNPKAAQTRIALEQTKAKILLVAGGEDRVWPSERMAKELQTARPQGTTLLIYPKAGHIFDGDGVVYGGGILMKTGGSAEENRKAWEDSDGKILAFFASAS